MGFWIAADGNMYEFEYDGNNFHMDHAWVEFGTRVEGPDEAEKLALEYGWIRGYEVDSQIGLEWHSRPTPAAIETLMDWFDTHGRVYKTFVWDGPGQSTPAMTNWRKARAVLVSMLKSLNESPLTDYSYIGSDQPESLAKGTMDLAKSPGAKSKAIRMFQNTPFRIRVVFLNRAYDPSGGGTAVRSRGKRPAGAAETLPDGSLIGDITRYTKNKYGKDVGPEYLEYVEPFIKACKFRNSWTEESWFRAFLEVVGRPGLADLRSSPPRQHWLAFTPDEPNDAIASFGEDKVENYRNQGYEVRPLYTPDQLQGLQKKHANSALLYARYKAVFDHLYELNKTQNLVNTVSVELPDQIRPVEGEITFVINSDDGDGFYPFTPWMIAHRLGHALGEKSGSPFAKLNRSFQNDIEGMLDFYLKLPRGQKLSRSYIWGALAQIGKFRSAREKSFGDEGEFVLDCFAQYLIQGRVSFNPIGSEVIPMVARRYRNERNPLPVSPPAEIDTTQFNTSLIGLADSLNKIITTALNGVLGQVIAI